MKVKQGDFVTIDFPSSNGTETKRRPALVLSNEAINATGDVLLMQITSQSKRDGLSIVLEPAALSPPLPLKSFLRLHKVFTLDHQLVIKKLSQLDRSKFDDVLTALYLLVNDK